MRDIKFRAWNNQKLIYDAVLMEGEPTTKLFWGGNPGAVWNMDQPTVFMQYTGLTDRNGVKIYEGDIVDFGEYSGKQQVIWSDEDGSWLCHREVMGELKSQAYLGEVHEDCEVIGNIHQNKELLNQKA